MTAPLPIPGPRPAFLLGWRGNAFRFARDSIGFMLRLRREHGDVVALSRGGNGPLMTFVHDCPGTVFAFGPANNQAILSDTNTFQYSMLTGLEGTDLRHLGSGIFNMNGDKHRQQRRLMMPAFQKSRIEAYRDDMVALTCQCLADWAPGQQRDLARDMQRLTLRIACKALFGLDVVEQADEFGQLIQDWIKASSSASVIVFPYNLPLSPYRQYLRISRRLDEAIRSLIDRKRGKETEGDVLSLLLHVRDEDGTRMTDHELIGQTGVLFIAGHETTANALTWTLFLLAQHPAILADLHDELHVRLRGEAPTVEQLPELPLLERVLKESMRLLPPVPLASRFAACDTQLGAFAMPRGTEVVYSPYVTHLMEEVHEQPKRFLPERWLRREPTAYEYLPFGAGARMCIGASFALMEMKLVLALILQRFRLQVKPGALIDRYVGITLTPRHGMPMLVHEQDHRFRDNRSTIGGDLCDMVEFA